MRQNASLTDTSQGEPAIESLPSAMACRALPAGHTRSAAFTPLHSIISLMALVFPACPAHI